MNHLKLAYILEKLLTNVEGNMNLLNIIFIIILPVSFILTLLAIIFIYKLIKIKTQYKQTNGKIIEIKKITPVIDIDGIHSVISPIIQYEVN